ncbi:succinate dehydrogenase subunit B [Bacillus sp. OV194]|nr:succinate dehydrogenase subunit B [Bacillus sp. OV194]
MGEILFKIMRYNPEVEQKVTYDSYHVDAKKNMTVLDALFIILQEQDSSLSFRCSCRLGMCGTCGMLINNKGGLACRTKIENLGSEITVQPMRNFPIIKDLAVDMEPFFKQWKRIKPYFVPKDEEAEDFSVIPPDSGRRGIIDHNKSTECITCGLCYSGCSLVTLDDGYIGPAALNRAYSLIADERDNAGEERLELVAGEDGASRCHTLYECSEVCPKGISPTWSIQKLKTMGVIAAVKGGK